MLLVTVAGSSVEIPRFSRAKGSIAAGCCHLRVGGKQGSGGARLDVGRQRVGWRRSGENGWVTGVVGRGRRMGDGDGLVSGGRHVNGCRGSSSGGGGSSGCIELVMVLGSRGSCGGCSGR